MTSAVHLRDMVDDLYDQGLDPDDIIDHLEALGHSVDPLAVYEWVEEWREVEEPDYGDAWQEEPIDFDWPDWPAR